MPYSIHRAVLEIKLANSRLNAISLLAEQANIDETKRSEFSAAFSSAQEICQRAESIQNDTELDDIDPQILETFFELILQRDATMRTISGIHLELGSRKSSPTTSCRQSPVEPFVGENQSLSSMETDRNPRSPINLPQPRVGSPLRHRPFETKSFDRNVFDPQISGRFVRPQTPEFSGGFGPPMTCIPDAAVSRFPAPQPGSGFARPPMFGAGPPRLPALSAFDDRYAQPSARDGDFPRPLASGFGRDFDPSHAPAFGNNFARHAAPGSDGGFLRPPPIQSLHIRLPQIGLKHFDGNLKEWSTFFDFFRTIVHGNDALSPIEKFQYLISCLSKEPLTLVRHLPLTHDNYEIAWKSLVGRYQNDRVLASLYWQSICNSSRLSSDSPQALRELLNVFGENLTALSQFHQLDFWDFTLFNWLLQKLDPSTRKRFELEFSHSQFPTFTDLMQFAANQCRAMESTALSRTSSVPPTQTRISRNALVTNTDASKKQQSCFKCKGDHVLSRCPSFLEITPPARYRIVKTLKLCTNCLSPAHSVTACASTFTCRHCASNHHSLLHFKEKESHPLRPGIQDPSAEQTETPAASTPATLTTARGVCAPFLGDNTVLLATALVNIRDHWGNFHSYRALLDSGSQSSFISESARKRLGLNCGKNTVPITGIGQTKFTASRGTTECHIQAIGSCDSPWTFSAIVLTTICQQQPCRPLPQLDSFRNLTLADPGWNVPGPVDLLLGADVFALALMGGLIPADDQNPAAIETKFGWVLMGTTPCTASLERYSFFVSTEPTLDATVKRFWEVEEVPSVTVMSPLDNQVEALFKSTHFRDQTGRFGVQLPFQDLSSLPVFKGSRAIADRRLELMERRLQKSSTLQSKYVDFMKDYLESGHMTLLNSNPSEEESYFIPHHCVFKNGSDKLRVVFDASARDANGISLNDALYAGPKLQPDIGAILSRFRFHRYVFTCDVRQMFRQILIDPVHRNFQLIRWRFSVNEHISTYRLNTVTYGMKSSPYLAIRCLLPLAEDGDGNFPLAAKAINSSLYVDDFACGADSQEDANVLKSQIIGLLKTCGLQLRKWASNDATLLNDIPPEHCQLQPSTFDGETRECIKILGLQWQSSSDSFSFSVVPVDSPCSKRNILSEVARIYDPLGFVSPLSFLAKRLIQHLWTLGIGWDDLPPDDACAQWERFKSSLAALSSLTIPRFLKPTSVVSCQLHAFCDASELGYAGVVYLRFLDTSANVSISLAVAKSKVAPLKRLSIPRLELSAAVLLSRLVVFVQEVFAALIVFDDVFAWSDSTVALTWIRSSPHRWKTFVANRVTAIQDRIPPSCWRHVQSADNPADPASRGLLPIELLNCALWWEGPQWLRQPPAFWPVDPVGVNTPVRCAGAELEEKSVALTVQRHVDALDVDTLLTRFSSLRKIQGIVAFSLRFIDNLRFKKKLQAPLTHLDLHRALLHMVKVVQSTQFYGEIHKIQNGELAPRHLQRLAPFIDSEGILRVGGRLRNADLSFDTKHPALLPRDHPLTTMIIQQIHDNHLHPGINTTVYLLQENFWVLSAHQAVRRCISKCYRCFKAKPASPQPLMGNLPAARVSQVKPFSIVGVDYGGPFSISLARRRGAKTHKAYLCLFVCFATKALHLEVASDLSADTFLAALRRFIARRGRCSQIHSDCGTNFVGANRVMNENLKIAADAEAISWHFNPPSSPHFGGLWESGIKSVKTHIHRVIGSQILTYEELSTLVVQIEGLLNSRPLCGLSTDPNDLSVLTPGHFLTLEPLTAPPNPNLSHLVLNRLSRWQLVQRLQQDYWSRWQNEYLHNLYQLSRWSKAKQLEPIDVGTLVLIKDERLPPLQWQLGRIQALHPGNDHIARVATVLTKQGQFKRPFVKLCPLPTQ